MKRCVSLSGPQISLKNFSRTPLAASSGVAPLSTSLQYRAPASQSSIIISWFRLHRISSHSNRYLNLKGTLRGGSLVTFRSSHSLACRRASMNLGFHAGSSGVMIRSKTFFGLKMPREVLSRSWCSESSSTDLAFRVKTYFARADQSPRLWKYWLTQNYQRFGVRTIALLTCVSSPVFLRLYFNPLVLSILLAKRQVTEVDRIESHEVPCLRHPGGTYQFVVLRRRNWVCLDRNQHLQTFHAGRSRRATDSRWGGQCARQLPWPVGPDDNASRPVPCRATPMRFSAPKPAGIGMPRAVRGSISRSYRLSSCS